MRVVVADCELEVPFTITLYVPVATALLAVSVSTLVPVVGFAENDAVTPLGRTDVTARFTLPVNPAMEVTVIVEEPEPPWVTDRAAGEAVRVKPIPVPPSARLCVA